MNEEAGRVESVSTTGDVGGEGGGGGGEGKKIGKHYPQT